MEEMYGKESDPMKTIILRREDVQNPVHPYFWKELCEDLGLAPKCDCEDWPEQIELVVSSATRDD